MKTRQGLEHWVLLAARWGRGPSPHPQVATTICKAVLCKHCISLKHGAWGGTMRAVSCIEVNSVLRVIIGVPDGDKIGRVEWSIAFKLKKCNKKRSIKMRIPTIWKPNVLQVINCSDLLFYQYTYENMVNHTGGGKTGHFIRWPIIIFNSLTWWVS